MKKTLNYIIRRRGSLPACKLRRIAINLIINTRMYLLPMYTFLMISGHLVLKPFVVLPCLLLFINVRKLIV